MSLIPGEGSSAPNIASAIGSGIDITTSSGGVDFLSAYLVAGTNCTIVPSVSNKSITINAAPGGGGIISVDAASGAGVTTTTAAGHVSITSAIVGGNGISVVQSPTSTTLTINNDQTITTANGSGISAVTAGDATALSANLVAGSGISITNSGLNTSKTISNTGVTQVQAGSGISIGGLATQPIVANTGLLGLMAGNAGAGISIGGTNTNPLISNTGVTQVQAGTGIGVGGTAGVPTINNNGVLGVSAGSNVTITGTAQNPIINAAIPTPPVLLPWVQFFDNFNGAAMRPEWFNVRLIITLALTTGSQQTLTNWENVGITPPIGTIFQFMLDPNGIPGHQLFIYGYGGQQMFGTYFQETGMWFQCVKIANTGTISDWILTKSYAG
jgi:hypothetical protein